MTLLIRLVALVALAAGSTACSRSETAQARAKEPAVKPVQVEEVRRDAVKRSVDVVGTLAAVDQVTISSEADGKVSKILADLGDRVTAGQVLIQLDREKAEYTLDQQEAALARALAQFGAPDPQHLPEIEKTPDAQRANADLLQAQQSYDRATELFKRTLISQEAFDAARTTLQAKKAGYESALQNARNLRASIQGSEATMKLAGRQLRDTEIRAPFTGMVVERAVSAGEYVRPDSRVATIVDTDSLRVEITVPEADIPNVRQGMEINFRTSGEGKVYHGKIRYVGPSVRRQSRDAIVEAVFTNEKKELRPGMFVTARLALGEQTLPAVPAKAVRADGSLKHVFVATGGRLEDRLVQAAEPLGNEVPIVSGVKSGEQVVAELTPDVRDGAKVK